MVQGDDAAMRSATIAAYISSTDQGLKDTVAGELPAMKPAGQLILLGVLADQPDVAARPGVLAVLKAADDDKIRAAALECSGASRRSRGRADGRGFGRGQGFHGG